MYPTFSTTHPFQSYCSIRPICRRRTNEGHRSRRALSPQHYFRCPFRVTPNVLGVIAAALGTRLRRTRQALVSGGALPETESPLAAPPTRITVPVVDPSRGNLHKARGSGGRPPESEDGTGGPAEDHPAGGYPLLSRSAGRGGAKGHFHWGALGAFPKCASWDKQIDGQTFQIQLKKAKTTNFAEHLHSQLTCDVYLQNIVCYTVKNCLTMFAEMCNNGNSRNKYRWCYGFIAIQ